MTRKEIDLLQAVLDKFDYLEDVCIGKIDFLKEHKFHLEQEVMEVKRQAYRECFNELQNTLRRMVEQDVSKED